MNKRALIAVPLWLCLAGAFARPATATVGCPALTDSAASQALDRRVEEGDHGAAACLARSLHSLDGGELEDALVALGRYGENNPVELLLLAHRGIMAKASMASAVTMLPGSLSDNLEAQAAALEARRSRFTKIGRSDLSAERQIALRSLASAIEEVRSVGSNR